MTTPTAPDPKPLDTALADYRAKVVAQVALLATAAATAASTITALQTAATAAVKTIADLRAQLAAALDPPVTEVIELSNFVNSIGKALPGKGYTGKGIGKTVITMKPMTSSMTPTVVKGETNPLRLLRTAAGTGGTFGGFTLIGTAQGKPQHMYGGLMIASQVGAQVTDLLVQAIPGNAGGPPGETFGVSDWKCKGITYTRVEVDGRDLSGTMTKPPDGSNRVGASGMGANSSSEVVWVDCYVHDHYYGMPTAWDTVGFITRDFRSVNNWRGINHERVTGVVEHHNPTLVLAAVDQARNAVHHFSFNNDITDCPTITVFAPAWAGGHPSAKGALCVQIQDAYAGWKQKQKTIPTFLNPDGSPMLIAEYGAPGNPELGIAPTPAKNMAAAIADPKHSVVIFR